MLADIQGVAMWWFSKGKRKEIWDEDIQWPIGDIEAAHKIRDICRSAADSAEKVAALLIARTGIRATTRPNGTNAPPRSQWRSISDDLLRDAAVRQIVSLCVKADDLKTARILFRAIQAVSIREDVLNDHPVLRQ